MKNFDELLDGVLREDTAAQPRAGLEGRVMARVRAEERLSRGSVSRYLNSWRSWRVVPTAACLGIVAVVWYVAGGGVPQPAGIVLRQTAPALSSHPAQKPESAGDPHGAEGDSKSGLGGSGRAWRDAHLSDDKTVAKMGHPASITRETTPLPKLGVFPTPSVVAEPVRELAEVSRQHPGGIVPEVAEDAVERKPPAPLKIEPIEIAKIEIAPLYPVKDTQAKEVQGR